MLRVHVDDLLLDVDAAEPGQLTQAHLEDVLGLHLAELERHGHQAGLGFCRILAAADEGDDLVDDIECLQSSLEDVLASAGLVEPELRTAGDDVDLVAQVALQRGDEVERARHAVDERNHVDAEAGLQLGELVEVVEHDVGVGVALERDHQAGLAAGGAVVDVGDAVEIAGRRPAPGCARRWPSNWSGTAAR